MLLGGGGGAGRQVDGPVEQERRVVLRVQRSVPARRKRGMVQADDHPTSAGIGDRGERAVNRVRQVGNDSRHLRGGSGTDDRVCLDGALVDDHAFRDAVLHDHAPDRRGDANRVPACIGQGVGQGTGALLRHIDLIGLQQHFRQIRPHVRSPHPFGLAHRHFEKAP